MSEDWTVQVSFKVSQNDPMINIRANSMSDLDTELEEFSELIPKVSDIAELLRGVSVVKATLGSNQAAAPVQQAQAAAPAAAPSGAPTCAHGEMNHQGGPGSGKSWEAYFCSGPRDLPDDEKCTALFWDKYKKQFLPPKGKK